MHFLVRLALVVTVTALPAFADSTPVRVYVPLGLQTSDVSTSDSQKTGFKYVTIDSVQVVNPSRHNAQSYEPEQFHLLADDKTYVPSVRPGLGSLDLQEGAALSPGGTMQVTVSFLVPDSVKSAKFEFTPHWTNDAGATVDWCCLYL
jgi:hypothetical protein